MSVWVTRPQPERTTEALRQAGFDAFARPLLEIKLVAPVLPADEPDLILFVSRNAVRGFLDSKGKRALDLGATIACVGDQAVSCLHEAGFWPDDLLSAPTSIELLRDLSQPPNDWAKVWIPRGNREGSATKLFPAFFRNQGANVFGFQVYENLEIELTPADLKMVAKKNPRIVIFHSPSAVEAFSTMVWGKGVIDESRVHFVTIGKTTARAVKKLGWPVTSASEPTDRGLVASLRELNLKE